MKSCSKKSNELAKEITPCKGCMFNSVCKYKNGVQIQYDKGIFRVSIECRVIESLDRRH